MSPVYKDRSYVSEGGVSLGAIIGVVFLILKLCGVIDWSWVWVLSPFWISAGFWMILYLIVLLIEVFIGGKD